MISILSWRKTKPFLIPLSSALHHGELDSQTIKVIFVHVSVIVQIIEISNQELDAIIPGILSHLKTVRDLVGSKSDIINEGNDIVKIILSIFPSLNFSILIFYMNQPSICNIKHVDHLGTGRLFFMEIESFFIICCYILSRGPSRSNGQDKNYNHFSWIENVNAVLSARSYRGNKSH